MRLVLVVVENLASPFSVVNYLAPIPSYRGFSGLVTLVRLETGLRGPPGGKNFNMVGRVPPGPPMEEMIWLDTLMAVPAGRALPLA